MNPNYRHTITLYNCLKACDSPDRKDHWHRTVLTGCYYKAMISRTDSGTSAGVNNTYAVRIPADPRYLPYPSWAELSEEERNWYYTVNLDDVVVYGECLEEITGVSGQTAVQLLKRHKPDAFKVTACSDNTDFPVEKHIRLGG